MNDEQKDPISSCNAWELLKKIEFIPSFFWENDAEYLVRHLLENEACRRDDSAK